MKKFAVVLSGNGVFDGAEIHESAMTLLAIMQQGGAYEIFAPDIDQYHVINHITGEEMPESRNVLVESARIARGNIKPLSEFHAGDFDYLIFPGGFGAAKNLSSFAFDGVDCSVNHDVEKAIRSMIEQEKPIGALCIAPVLLSKILGQMKNFLKNGKDIGNLKISALLSLGHQLEAIFYYLGHELGTYLNPKKLDDISKLPE